MTPREQFFAVLDGDLSGGVPYFPDLSTWYVPRRTPKGVPHKYGAGELVPNSDTALHCTIGEIPMPAQFQDWTYLDFYRHFNWGVPVHLYDWYDVTYDGAEETSVVQDGQKIRRWRCAQGELTMVYTLAEDGSWCPTEMPIKNLQDLALFRSITERMHYVPRYDRIRETMAEIGQQGVLDLVIRRSPFGKLVHELMGFENLVYAFYDDPTPIHEWMTFQEQHDLQLIQLAAAAPDARVVILSDHSDENLISPQHYRDYCIPYYRVITEQLHRGKKFVSTHLDGNFKGYMPLLHETGFDILDGCTPFPMTNWTPTELAETAARNDQMAWCGVPSTLFCQGVADDVIMQAGQEIIEAFRKAGAKVILNVGDIVSPTANIEQVIQLGQLVAQ